jgi:hypothetical protein
MPGEFLFHFLKRWGLATVAQAGPELLGSGNPHASAFWVAGTIGMYHHVWLWISVTKKGKGSYNPYDPCSVKRLSENSPKEERVVKTWKEILKESFKNLLD